MAQPSKYSKKIRKRENRLLDYRDATRPSARAVLTEWEAQRPKASEANESQKPPQMCDNKGKEMQS